MTTIAAIKKGKRLCIGADALTLFGSRKEIANKHVHKGEKIIKIGNNFVGIAGHPSWNLILVHYFAKKKNITEWRTVDQIFDIFNTIHRHLKKTYFLNPLSSNYDPFESSEFELLIINAYGIFEIDYLRTVRQYAQFSAIGTGEEYALGAIQAVYNTIKDPQDILKIGIEASSRFDKKTELPLQIHCIDL